MRNDTERDGHLEGISRYFNAYSRYKHSIRVRDVCACVQLRPDMDSFDGLVQTQLWREGREEAVFEIIKQRFWGLLGSGEVPFTRECWVCAEANCFLYGSYAQFGTQQLVRASSTIIGLSKASNFTLQYELATTDGTPNYWQTRVETVDGSPYAQVLETLSDSDPFSYVNRSFFVSVPQDSTAVRLIFESRQVRGYNSSVFLRLSLRARV